MKRSIIADAMSGDAAMTWEMRILGSGDQAILDHVLRGVFDREIEPRLAAEFLDDGRHHLAVAIDQGRVIGFASATTTTRSGPASWTTCEMRKRLFDAG